MGLLIIFDTVCWVGGFLTVWATMRATDVVTISSFSTVLTLGLVAAVAYALVGLTVQLHQGRAAVASFDETILMALVITVVGLGLLATHFTLGPWTRTLLVLLAPAWTIAAHTEKGGTWYDLQPADLTVIPAIIACGHVSAATADDLSARGLSGKPVPELNYAQPLGLYLIRPAPRPSPTP